MSTKLKPWTWKRVAEKEVGRGAFGVVSRVEVKDPSGKSHLFAVKRIPTEKFKDREVKLLERLTQRNTCHRHILCLVNRHDVDEDSDGKSDFVELWFEWLGGGELHDYIRKHADPKSEKWLKEVVSIARRLLRGIAYMHSKGIAHRDIKPANIMRTDKGDIKLIDFGLGCHHCTAGGYAGTPPYISPTVWRKSDASAEISFKDLKAHDLFSYGMVLLAMLTPRGESYHQSGKPWSRDSKEDFRNPYDRDAVARELKKTLPSKYDWLGDFTADLISERLTTAEQAIKEWKRMDSST